jgi:carboxypeptidase family protein/TonB-dependent receptor-like protein
MNTRSLSFLSLFVLLLLVCLAPSPISAQTETGAIAGTVTDPSGAIVPGAKVTVTSVGKQNTRTATADGRGNFVISNLQPGTYDVTVEQSGFSNFTRRVDVTVGSRNTVDAQLSVGSTGTTVEVTAQGGVQVETQTQAISQVVSGQEVVQLPTITRNPYDLVATAGNISTSEAQSLRGTGFSVNGQRAASTNILLDGGENRDEFTTNVGTNVPLDSVQEFRVLSSNFSAEYGRASGGVVNVATRSGTNTLHGTVYEFNRNSKLAANNYQNNATGQPRDHFNRNQFGYSVGGPIIKNRVFFFQSTEWTRVRSALNSQQFILDPAFIALTAPNTQSYFNSVGAVRPDTHMGQTFTADQLFANGDLSGPIAGVPGTTPVLDTVNFPSKQDAGGGDPQNTYFLTGRVDFNITDHTTLFGRYGADHETFFPGFLSTSPYQGFETGQNTLNQNVVINLTHIFSPNIVSQSKVDYNRFNLFQPLGSAGTVPGLFPQPVTPLSIGGLNLMFPGYLPLVPGSALPFGGPQNLYQFYQDVSWTIGAHQLRIGGQFVQIRDNRTFGAFETGFEVIGSQGGGLDEVLPNLVAGQLFQFQGAVDPQGKFPCFSDPATRTPIVTPDCSVTLPVSAPSFTRHNTFNDGAAYIQDTWKTTNRLTLNLGVRWEYYGVQHNNDRSLDSNFFLGSGANLFEQIANGFVATSTDPRNPIGKLWSPQWRNFAPRVGFALDIFGNGRSSLRGGYGIGYERNFGNVTFNVIQNPPAYAVVSLIAPTDVPSLSITNSNFGPLGGSSGTAPILRTSLRAVDQKIKPAYGQFWSLAFEQELVPNTVMGLEYSGSRGVHQYSISNLNPLGSGVAYLGLDPTVVDPLNRMNPQYSNINFRGSNGDSYYHGLNVRLQSNNFKNYGVTFTANYTWSHAIDDLSSSFSESSNNFNLGFTDPFRPGLDRGNADFDIRHRFILSAVWEPTLYKNDRGWRGQVLGGWGFAPIFEARTGTPFTVFDCFDAFNTCPRYAPLAGGRLPTTGNMDPPSSGDPNTFNYLVLPPRNDFFSPLLGVSDFGICSAPGEAAPNDCPFPSNMTGRNQFRGPNHWNWDMGIHKNFKITERIGLQLRGELFNAVNHPNLFVIGSSADPSTNSFDVGQAGCPAAGGAVAGVNLCPVVQAKKGGLPGILLNSVNTREHRNVQLAIKLTF